MWGMNDRIAVVMGSRGSRGGDEIDAHSRRSRRLLRWRPVVLRIIKRRFVSARELKSGIVDLVYRPITLMLVAAISPANLHIECETGAPVGNEFR